MLKSTSEDVQFVFIVFICFHTKSKKGVKRVKSHFSYLHWLWLLVKKLLFGGSFFVCWSSLWAREFRWYLLICLLCRPGTQLHHSPGRLTVPFSTIICLSQGVANPFLARNSQKREGTTTKWVRSRSCGESLHVCETSSWEHWVSWRSCSCWLQIILQKLALQCMIWNWILFFDFADTWDKAQ